MALEALSNAITQATQDYFKAKRQDELLAGERAREDAVYQRRLQDQIAAEGRQEEAQKRAETRAEERRGREKRDDIKVELQRITELSGPLARQAMRETVAKLAMNPDYLDPKKVPDDQLPDLYENALKTDAGIKAAAETMAKTRAMVESYPEVRKLEKLKADDARPVLMNGLARADADYNAALAELDKAKKAVAEEIRMLPKQITSRKVEAEMGVPRGSAEWKQKASKLTGSENASDAEIAQYAGLSKAIESEFEIAAKGAMARDPSVSAVGAKLEMALKLRNTILDHAISRNIDLTTPVTGNYLGAQGAAGANSPASTSTPAGAAVNSSATPTPGGVLSPDLLAKQGREVAAARSGGTPAPAPGAAPAPTAGVPAPASAAAPDSGPGMASSVGNFLSNNAGTIAATGAAAAPKLAPMAAQGAGYLANAAKSGFGAASEYLSGIPAVRRAIDFKMSGLPLAGKLAAGASAAGNGYLVGQAADVLVPHALNAVGAVDTSQVYGNRTPNLSEVYADAYLAATEKTPERKFNDWYTDRYQTIVRANVADEVKQQEMSKLQAARDQWFSQGNTWDTPLNAGPAPGNINDYPQVKEFFNAMNRPIPAFTAGPMNPVPAAPVPAAVAPAPGNVNDYPQLKEFFDWANQRRPYGR